MPAADAHFKKLPGLGFTLRGKGRLWLGPDCILQVTSSLVVERYRRFYFRDVEALLIRRTRVRLAGNLIAGSIAGVVGAIAGTFFYFGKRADDVGVRSLFYVFAGIIGVFGFAALLILLINTLLGPSCACFVRTPAGTDRLAAPTRLRPARRFLSAIKPIIEAAQTAV